jgi:hypothetical protein
MELVLVSIWLFVFFFGSVILLQAAEFGFRIGDKTLCACGDILKASFKMMIKLIFMLFSITFSKANIYRLHRHAIRPFLTVKHTAIPYAYNSKLVRSVSREPVVIEHPPQKTK